MCGCPPQTTAAAHLHTDEPIRVSNWTGFPLDHSLWGKLEEKTSLTWTPPGVSGEPYLALTDEWSRR